MIRNSFVTWVLELIAIEGYYFFINQRAEEALFFVYTSKVRFHILVKVFPHC